ncbi:hypothetical protein CRUP_006308 [Coryphaenoides rupestris]|nr:hypothetical protein CRUP_006308 [Coryphaenoides rupestris]
MVTSHPGTNVSVIDLFDRSSSLQPLWKQVEGFKEAIYPIMQNAEDGVHFICYSQGGLICRGILATLPDHNVHTFISLSSPQAGQYGDTDYLKYLFPQFMKSNLFHLERENPNSTEWKSNFLKIKKLVLVGGPDDGVITPWQSSQFGFYDNNETVVEIQHQEHIRWHSNLTVFHSCIEKWLQ